MKMLLLLAALTASYTEAKIQAKKAEIKNDKSEDSEDENATILATVFGTKIKSTDVDMALGMYLQQMQIQPKSEEELNKYRKKALQEVISNTMIRHKHPELEQDNTVQQMLSSMIAQTYISKQAQTLLAEKDVLEAYYYDVYLKELDLPMLYSAISCGFETEAQAQEALNMISDGKTPEAAIAAINKKYTTKYTFKEIDVKQNEEGNNSPTIFNLNAAHPVIYALSQYKTPISNTVHNAVITLKTEINNKAKKKHTPYVILFIKDVTLGAIDDFQTYNHDKMSQGIAMKKITTAINADVEKYKKSGEIEIHNNKK